MNNTIKVDAATKSHHPPGPVPSPRPPAVGDSRWAAAHVDSPAGQGDHRSRRPVRAPTAEGMSVKSEQPPLMCRLNIHHVWENAHTSDGERFVRCARCLKERWTTPKGTAQVGPSMNAWNAGGY